MIKLGNRAISRIQQLLELDVKKLKSELQSFENTPIEKTNTYMATGKYELTPATKEDTQRQLSESEDALKEISEEVNRATFVFGLSSVKEVTEEIKGLQTR